MIRSPRSSADDLDQAEIWALLDHLFVRTGLDFGRYSQRSVRRRLRHVMLQDGVESIAELRSRIRDGATALRLAERLCVKVTSLFRDPPFWKAFREHVVPLLRQLPLVRVWHAGCATGEEAYSLAIVLREEGLLGRSRIYATDIDDGLLDRARAGAYPLDQIREHTPDYVRAGGVAGFSEHYTASANGVVFREELRRRIVFSRHDLATDASFNEFHVVMCRNVLIYFEASLQQRAHELLWRSVSPGGVLALGLREVVPPYPGRRYEPLDLAHKIYRRVDALR